MSSGQRRCSIHFGQLAYARAKLKSHLPCRTNADYKSFHRLPIHTSLHNIIHHHPARSAAHHPTATPHTLETSLDFFRMEEARALAGGFLSCDPVTITLEDGGSFAVQKGLLCNASDYFKKALEGGFAETQTMTLTLPGCTTSTFQLFLFWLITGKLPNINRTIDPDLEIPLVELYVLADMLMMPTLQNNALEELFYAIGTASQPPSVKTVQATYAGTNSDSRVRKYIRWRAICAWLHSDSSYNAQEKTVLGAIPGFFEEFTRQMLIFVTAKGGLGTGWAPQTTMSDTTVFYVYEGV